MNNKNKILVACLALLLVLSVGYALFSETIEINGTATAKGNFDIGFVCTSTTPIGTATGNCSISGQTITTSSTLTKPTDGVLYEITLTNNGSIPAVLKTISSPNNHSRNNGSETSTNADSYFDSSTFLIAYYGVNEISGDGTNYDDYIESQKLKLQPNETMTIRIAHSWSSTSEQPVVPANGSTIDYDITLGFEQVAAN